MDWNVASGRKRMLFGVQKNVIDGRAVSANLGLKRPDPSLLNEKILHNWASAVAELPHISLLIICGLTYLPSRPSIITWINKLLIFEAFVLKNLKSKVWRREWLIRDLSGFL